MGIIYLFYFQAKRDNRHAWKLTEEFMNEEIGRNAMCSISSKAILPVKGVKQ